MENQTTDEDLITEDNNYWVEQKLAHERLKNKDFYKTLIEEGYFTSYVKELVNALLLPENTIHGTRAVVIEKLVGVAGLQDYLFTVDALSSDGEQYEEKVVEEEVKERHRIEKLAMAYAKASQDPDFKLLIEDRYGKDYSRNQTSLITNSAILSSGKRTDVLEALAGVSTLDNYLVDIKSDYMQVLEQDTEEVEE